MGERRKIRRTADRDISYMQADAVQFWCHGIVEVRVDTREGKFIVTPILRDGREWPPCDITEMYEKFKREEGGGGVGGRRGSLVIIIIITRTANYELPRTLACRRARP